MRLCISALREAGRPLRAGAAARYAMLAKGLPVDDWRVNAEAADRSRIALGRGNATRRGLKK
jgi:hypothetical protein